MRIILIFVVLISFGFMVGCQSIHSPGGVAEIFVAEGGINIKRANEEDYQFVVEVYENEVGKFDLSGINTVTAVQRAQLIQTLFTFTPVFNSPGYPRCLGQINIIGEEQFVVTGHYKKFLNGPWWKIKVFCDQSNPQAEM